MINPIYSIPLTPILHPFVERLIGTIGREYLDRLFFWNTRDLQSNNAVGQRDEVKTRGVADNFNNHRHHRTRRRSPGADVDTAVTFNNTPVAPAGTTCLLTLVEVASRQVSTIPVNVTFRAAPATN